MYSVFKYEELHTTVQNMLVKTGLWTMLELCDLLSDCTDVQAHINAPYVVKLWPVAAI